MKTVLLIDSAPSIRVMYQEVILQAGHSAIAFRSAEEALNHLDSHGEPDLIVLNIRQPDMTGIEFCKKVKQTRREVPILLMSGLCDKHELANARNLGVEAWVLQPVEPQHFLNTIQDILGTVEHS